MLESDSYLKQIQDKNFIRAKQFVYSLGITEIVNRKNFGDGKRSIIFHPKWYSDPYLDKYMRQPAIHYLIHFY